MLSKRPSPPIYHHHYYHSSIVIVYLLLDKQQQMNRKWTIGLGNQDHQHQKVLNPKERA